MDMKKCLLQWTMSYVNRALIGQQNEEYSRVMKKNSKYNLVALAIMSACFLTAVLIIKLMLFFEV